MQNLRKLIERVRAAQAEYASYSQEQVDKIFVSAAAAANRARIALAKMAVAETEMGVLEDKVIKNHYAAENICNAYRSVKTAGVIEEDKAYGIKKIAEPIGVIAAIIPTTNPTSTAIFKALLCLKTRNGIILSAHPRARECTAAAARVVLDAAIQAGAPKDVIGWLDEPSIEITHELMRQADFILATGGLGLVKAAYSSGKPALGVGAGNTPAIIDKSADVKLAVGSIVHSKTFDNGLICASEQAVIADKQIYGEVKAEFCAQGCYFLNDDEAASVRNVLFSEGKINSKAVGKSASRVAELANISVPSNTKILIAELQGQDENEPLASEKLCPVLAMFSANDLAEAANTAQWLIERGGLGHTASVYLNETERQADLVALENKLKACRILINTPSSQGGIGDIYNFKLPPSLTLGCGSWGGNSVCENVGVKHLLNVKTVAERRENMLWFKAPPKIYFKRGCLPVALRELCVEQKISRAFIVTDKFLFANGYAKPICDKLAEESVDYTVFFDVSPDPTLECAKRGAEAMRAFKPDCIIALGGGSAMDAAKIMWVLYEHPEARFDDMAMRFMDIRKRVYVFPQMGEKARFVAVPTSAGTGSEVTPFAVITDEKSGVKYPLADYQLMPNMAIVDANLMLNAPQGLTAASGFDAAVHAIEAYASMLATDFTDALAKSSLKIMLEYLPRAYDSGANDLVAREKTANAATMAGMAFANSFLGVCHSTAHKLGSFFNLPHGIANALMIEEVMRFNASVSPEKMGTFPQYAYPHALRRYAELAEFLGVEGNTDEQKLDNLIIRLNTLKSRVGIRSSIKAYGVDEKEFLSRLDEMSEQAFDDQCTTAAARYPLISEIKQMYLNAYYKT